MRARRCPVCEPEAGDEYEDLREAIVAYQAAARPDCWRCEGHGLLVGEADAWEAREGSDVVVGDG